MPRGTGSDGSWPATGAGGWPTPSRTQRSGSDMGSRTLPAKARAANTPAEAARRRLAARFWKPSSSSPTRRGGAQECQEQNWLRQAAPDKSTSSASWAIFGLKTASSPPFNTPKPRSSQQRQGRTSDLSF